MTPIVTVKLRGMSLKFVAIFLGPPVPLVDVLHGRRNYHELLVAGVIALLMQLARKQKQFAIAT